MYFLFLLSCWKVSYIVVSSFCSARCSHEIICYNETLPHFKFTRFETEYNYDYLAIGDPDFPDYSSPVFPYDNPSSVIGNRTRWFENMLILDYKQVTDIWVNAESLSNKLDYADGTGIQYYFLKFHFFR